MADITEQARARQLLERKKTGYSTGTFLRQSVNGWVPMLIMVVMAVVVFYKTIDPLIHGLMLWIIGVSIGAFIRDIGWFVKIRKSWPFTEKVIDWEKVRQISEQK
jgi:ABC-type uncharacterized transport system permease subunit